MSKAHSAARGLAPVEVRCNNAACLHVFTSRARRHAVVRCPRCKRPVRVKREPAASRNQPQGRPQPARSPAVENVCQQVPAAFPPPAAPSPVPGRAEQVGEVDDGYAYIGGPGGIPVLADLAPDGRMVPVQLADQCFRLLAPGLCSVYGCREPARWTHDGWPVCGGCRIWLAG